MTTPRRLGTVLLASTASLVGLVMWIGTVSGIGTDAAGEGVDNRAEADPIDDNGNDDERVLPHRGTPLPTPDCSYFPA